jgi:hypothetical protein
LTVIVGVRCSDGIVIGADSAATQAAGNQHLMKMMCDKIFIVANRVVVATTGSVGQAQRLQSVIEAQYANKLFGKDSVTAAPLLTRESLMNFQISGIQHNPQGGWGLGAFVGAVFSDGAQLIEYPWTDFQPEINKGKLFFGSMGSGQTLADPFLSFVARVMWENKQPTVDAARFGVHWALSHTIECAPGGVGHPIKLATIKMQGGQWQCRLLEDEELQEQAQYIKEIEGHMRKYPQSAIAEAETVPPPKPPGAQQ